MRLYTLASADGATNRPSDRRHKGSIAQNFQLIQSAGASDTRVQLRTRFRIT